MPLSIPPVEDGAGDRESRTSWWDHVAVPALHGGCAIVAPDAALGHGSRDPARIQRSEVTWSPPRSSLRAKLLWSRAPRAASGARLRWLWLGVAQSWRCSRATARR